MAESSDNKQEMSDDKKPLDKINFILMGISVLMIIIGFIMTGSGEPSTETAYNPDIFSAVRTVVGPTLAFIGFVLMFFAILYKKKRK